MIVAEQVVAHLSSSQSPYQVNRQLKTIADIVRILEFHGSSIVKVMMGDRLFESIGIVMQCQLRPFHSQMIILTGVFYGQNSDCIFFFPSFDDNFRQ